MLVPRDVDFKSYKRKRSKIVVSANFGGYTWEILNFRRFIVDISVITPNWIVKWSACWWEKYGLSYNIKFSTSLRWSLLWKSDHKLAPLAILNDKMEVKHGKIILKFIIVRRIWLCVNERIQEEIEICDPIQLKVHLVYFWENWDFCNI